MIAVVDLPMVDQDFRDSCGPAKYWNKRFRTFCLRRFQNHDRRCHTLPGANGTGLASVRVASGWCLAFRRSSWTKNRLKPTHQLLRRINEFA